MGPAMIRILVGDALARLQELPDASVHCCVTSPPYWGLRNYKSDAGMIGLEPTLEQHIERLVIVFREVRRVLRDDGVLWLNYGDGYANAQPRGSFGDQGDLSTGAHGEKVPARKRPYGLKPKDLMLMPARVAMALQLDGWWLRSEIVWHKPNPMPESVLNRPTCAHEKVFLLAKSDRYFYDGDAVRQPYNDASIGRYDSPMHGTDPTGRQPKLKGQYAKPYEPGDGKDFKTAGVQDGREIKRRIVEKVRLSPNPLGANLRNVWKIPTHSFKDAHFATFPPALVEPCIKSGTSAHGVCCACGAPWVRQQEKKTTGQPSCECGEADTRPATVLDPFAGSGTVGLVAQRNGRDALLVEISGEYASMAERRIRDDAPLLAEVELA